MWLVLFSFANLHYTTIKPVCYSFRFLLLNLFFSAIVCALRLVHSGPDRGSPQPGGELSFATRTGTTLGIETHVFRAETCKDLSLWTRHIVTGCHTAAEMIKEVTTSKHSPWPEHAPFTSCIVWSKNAKLALSKLAFCCTVQILLLRNNFRCLFRSIHIHIMCKIHWRIYPILLVDREGMWDE